MLIHVRRRHIRAGVRGVSYFCPVALAYEAACGERPRVHIDILYTNDNYFLLSRAVQRFIARFDAGKPVKPFAFVLK